MNLQWANASVTKSLAAASRDISAAPSAETRTTTASNRTEGPPSILCFAATVVPSESVTPPILGATTSNTAPSASTAFTSAVKIAASAPSLSRIPRSEEHTSELQSLMRISYAVLCLKKQQQKH